MSPIRIVIADDHPVTRKPLKMALDIHKDFEVVGEAADGHEAVQLASELQLDVMLVDVAMPGLGGIQATRQIKAKSQNVEVVALSQYGDRETVFMMLDAGAKGYVTKSSGLEEVSRAIRHAAAGGYYVSQDLAGHLIEYYLEVQRKEAGRTGQQLSARQLEVVQLVVEGFQPKVIAEQLGLSVKTVETHRSSAMKKLGLKNIPALVKWAIKKRLVDGEP